MGKYLDFKNIYSTYITDIRLNTSSKKGVGSITNILDINQLSKLVLLHFYPSRRKCHPITAYK